MAKLNNFSGKLALRNIENIKLFSRSTKELYAESDVVKTGPVNQTIDMNYATGGNGNSRLAVFKSNKNIEIPIELGIFSLDLLSGQAGGSAVETSEVVFDKTYTTTIVDDLTIDHAVASGGGITVEEVSAADDNTTVRRFNQVAGAPAAADEYQITGTSITFFLGDVSIGSFIRVIQDVLTTNDIDVLTSLSNVFGGTYKAVLEVEVVDMITDALFIGQLTIFRANLSEAVNLNFQNDGEVAVHSANLVGLSDIITKKIWEFKIFNSSDL